MSMERPSAATRADLLRRALRTNPKSADTMLALAAALSELGEEAESARVFAQALFLKKWRTLPMLGKRTAPVPATAAAIADRARSLIDNGVGYSAVIASLAVAAAIAGDERQVRELLDFERFFRLGTLGAPDGMDIDRLNALLESEILSNLEDYVEPKDRAIRYAKRNNLIFRVDSPGFLALRRSLQEAVDAYINTLDGPSHHPFLRARPANWVFEGWAVVSDANSYHMPHVHSRAWISGVYYISRPPASRVDGTHCGWLRVGPPQNFGVSVSESWPERWIAPEPGTLVLMPAYFFHETKPLGVDEQRICIAFDVVPEEVAAVPDVGHD